MWAAFVFASVAALGAAGVTPVATAEPVAGDRYCLEMYEYDMAIDEQMAGENYYECCLFFGCP